MHERYKTRGSSASRRGDAKMNIVVTIPAYNEEKTIVPVIKDIKKYMAGNNYTIVVLDDGSIDQTRSKARKAGAVVYSHPTNYGLAETFRTEMKICLELKPDVIVHIDADGQYLARDIPKLLQEIEKGYDLVLGSRFLGHIEQMPLIKKIGNKIFSRLISGMIKSKITDAQTGFRAFKREVAEQVSIRSYHTYTQEQILRASKEKFRIKEVPVYFAKRDGKSRLINNPLEYASKAVITIMRIYRDFQPLKFFGLFGSLFFIPGFLLGLWITWIFIKTGAIGDHMPSTILAALLVIVGIQIWLFGFLADMVERK